MVLSFLAAIGHGHFHVLNAHGALSAFDFDFAELTVFEQTVWFYRVGLSLEVYGFLGDQLPAIVAILSESGKAGGGDK